MTPAARSAIIAILGAILLPLSACTDEKDNALALCKRTYENNPDLRQGEIPWAVIQCMIEKGYRFADRRMHGCYKGTTPYYQTALCYAAPREAEPAP